MTLEEKAKRYDEALEIAKKNYIAAQDLYGYPIGVECFKNTLENIFPELKESEDERIRKELTEFLKSASGGFLDTAIQCKTFGKWATWLEKQGDKLQGKTALEAIKEEKVDNQNCVKPTDTVEPKFKVGDWVVNRFGDVWHIDSFDKKNYQVSDGNGYYSYFPISVQDKMHLWTIQDAKDGDVLASDNGVIILVKESRSSSWGYRLSYHCAVLYDGTFEPREFHVTPEVFFPATKEQRDLLFSKMKKAGYEWMAIRKN